MLDVLAKILGPERAVTAWVNLRRFGLPVALFAGFLAVFFFIVTVSDPDRMEHVAYLRVEVINVTPLTQDINSGVFVDVRLPDGTELKLTETEGAISRELSDIACLEQRRDTETGEISHRLRRAHRCAE
ncbi:MAG: hypothetical protein WAO69_04570 [Aestuariivita sp.]|uniref:hypothetical protein n=1 Tax=Aestuariivita sp. TaxID=1872407 RepID=UPI003BB03521